jgi:hypothetical protein
VKVFNGSNGQEIRSFFAYDPLFAGGIDVAGVDADGDLLADIATGAGPGTSPLSKVFSGLDGGEISAFDAFDPAFAGGIFLG